MGKITAGLLTYFREKQAKRQEPRGGLPAVNELLEANDVSLRSYALLAISPVNINLLYPAINVV